MGSHPGGLHSRDLLPKRSPQAVILLETETLEDAQRMLAQLPLVRAGLTEFEVIGLRPYPCFARLFADP